MASQYVDERIVEMRIDNDNFEKGARQTISTLEKLEQALHLKGDVSAMDELNESVSGFKADGMISGLEKIQSSFSALEIAGMRVISNLTDSVYNFATKTIKSFTVEPISQGFSKFGEKTTAVSTLTAQGYELEKVNQLMEDLNWFTDETSYNFTDMVGNIAKFTATGQDLDQSVTAMEGIALWAALSGQNATKASMAMYQLSQAMGKGALKYDDYKSIQNASMDTQEFRQQAAAAAVELGYLKETAEGVWETTEKTAKSGQAFDLAGLFSSDALSRTSWFTSDVMMNVFNKYSRALGAVQEYMVANGIDTASQAMKQMKSEAQSLADSLGITLDQAFEKLGWDLDEFSLKAFEAGQNARTWADVVDSVKDAVSTGWMTTFEKFFGDAETATGFWTDLANQFYDIFAAGGERRNSILELAMNGGKAESTLTKSTMSLEAGWSKFEDRVESSGHTMEEFSTAVYKVADRATLDLIENFGGVEEALQRGGISLDLFKQAWYELTGTEEEAAETTEYVTSAAMGSLEDMRDVAMQILRGDWGNGDERREALEALGYDYELMQAMAGNLNGNYGLSDEGLLDAMETYYRYNNIAARTGYETFAEYMEACAQASEVTTEVVVDGVEDLYNAARNGVAVGEDIEKAMEDTRTGGDYFRDGIVNILETINALKDAFDDIKLNFLGFKDEDSYVAAIADRLRSVFKVFWQITEGVKNFVTGEKFLGGMEAILGVIFTILNGIGDVAGFIFGIAKAGMKLVGGVLGTFLELLGSINKNGAFQNFATALKNIFGALAVPLEIIAEYLGEIFDRIRASGKLNEFISKVSQKIGDISVKFAGIATEFKNFMLSEKVRSGIITFLGKSATYVTDLKNGFSGLKIGEKLRDIWQWIKNIFGAIGLENFSFENLFGTIGNFLSPLMTILFGATEDAKERVNLVFDAIGKAIQERWDMLKERFGNITLLDILKGVRIGVATVMLARFSQLLGSFKKVADEVKTIPEGLKDVLTSTTKVLDSVSGSIKANTIIKLAIALGILAAAMIGLSFVPADKLTHVATVIGLMMILLTTLAKSISGINKLTGDKITGNTISGTLNIFNGLAAKLVGFALAIAAVAASIVSFKKNQITWKDVGLVLGSIGILLAMYIGFSAVMKRIAKNDQSNAWGNAAMLLAMVVAIRMMIKPIKQLAEIQKSELELKRGIAALALLMGLITAMVGIIAIIEGSGIMKREGSTFKKFGGTGANFLKIAAGLLVMALAINALLFPIRKLSELWAEDNGNKLWGGLGALAALLVILGLFAGLLGNIGAKNNSGGNFLKFAAGMVVVALALDLMIPAFLTFAGVVTTIATAVPWENLTERMDALYKAIAPLGALVIVLAGLGVAMAFFGIGLAAVGVGVFSASAGFLLLSVALFALAKGVDIIVEAFPKFIEGLADAGRTIRERKGDLVAGILLFGALAAVLFLLSKSFKNIFGGRNFGKMFGNLATSMVGGIGNLFAKLGTGLVDQLPNIMKLMGLIAVMIGLYMLDIIPDLVEIGVKAVMIFFTSLAESIDKHKDELIDSITSIIKSILSVVRGVVTGFWEEANLGEKILTVAVIAAVVTGKLVQFGTAIGGKDGKGGFVGTIATGVSALSGGMIGSLGSVLGWLLVILAIAALVDQGIREMEANYQEAKKNRNEELFGEAVPTVETRVNKYDDIMAEYDALLAKQQEAMDAVNNFTYDSDQDIDELIANLDTAATAANDFAVQYEVAFAELATDIAGEDHGKAYRSVYKSLIEGTLQDNAYYQEYLERTRQTAEEASTAAEEAANATATAAEETSGAKDMMTEVMGEIGQVAGELSTAVTEGIESATTAVTDGSGNIETVLGGLAGDIPEIADVSDGTYLSGWNTMAGLSNGVGDGFLKMVQPTVSNIITSLVDRMNAMLGVASPSTITWETGKFVMMGLMFGMRDNEGGTLDEVNGFSGDLIRAITDSMAQVGLIAGEDFTISPIISPVMDYSGISGAANELNGMFRTSAMLAELGEIAASRVVNSQINYMAETQDILNQLHVMSEQINSLGVSMANMKVVLDSGALVGATSAQIDRQLGIRAVRKGRGN